MFARLRPLALVALTAFVPYTSARINDGILDTNNTDTIKNVTSYLAKTIIALHDEQHDGSPPGLFDGGVFNSSYAFWESGAVWNTLLEYGHLTGDSQFNTKIADALVFQLGNLNAFMPVNQTKTLGNDDQSSWGLAALTAAEFGLSVPQGQSGSWLDFAANVFNTQVQRWDIEGSCNGGLRWQIFPTNNGYDYLNTHTASNFFLLSARLARFTGNKTYTEWAEKAYQWTEDRKLINNFKVLDGASAKENCSTVSKIEWSKTHAVFTEGVAVMYNLTNGADKWKTAVTGFVNTTKTFVNSTVNVLEESACENTKKCYIDEDNVQNMRPSEVLDIIQCMNAGQCSLDQRAYKGVAARSYYRTIQSAPFTSTNLQPILISSAQRADRSCVGPSRSSGDREVDTQTVYCAFKWTETPVNNVVVNVENDLGEMSNALAVIQGLLWPQAKALSSSSSAVGGSSDSGSGSGAGAAKEDAAKNSVGRVQASWGLVTVVGGFIVAAVL